jgi:hypothetical protein
MQDTGVLSRLAGHGARCDRIISSDSKNPHFSRKAVIQKWFRMHSGALPAILVSLSNRWNVLYTPVGREVPPQQRSFGLSERYGPTERR